MEREDTVGRYYLHRNERVIKLLELYSYKGKKMAAIRHVRCGGPTCISHEQLVLECQLLPEKPSGFYQNHVYRNGEFDEIGA